MFNSKDALFSKRDDTATKDARAGSLLRNAPVSSRTDTALPPAASPAEPAAATAPPAAQSGGSKLIVGPDIKLKGVEITDCDTLVVEGRVEASMDSRVIQIAEHGVYAGTVGIDVAEIHGRFEGELTARKHLIIHKTGRVSGAIRYGKITVEDGGEITGTISTIADGTTAPSAGGAHVDIMTPYDPFAHKTKSPGPKPAGAPH
jgi:cytoskeletal protein CcmA (bactofilin family)